MIIIEKGKIKETIKDVIKTFEREITKVLKGHFGEPIDDALLHDIEDELYEIINKRFDSLKGTHLEVTFSDKSNVFVIYFKSSYANYKIIGPATLSNLCTFIKGVKLKI